MSRFRQNLPRCFAWVFTLWFALLTVGAQGLHTHGRPGGDPAHLSVQQAWDVCGHWHPGLVLAGLFSGKLICVSPTYGPDLSGRPDVSATIAGACCNANASDCLACQFLSNSKTDGRIPVVVIGSLSAVDFTAPAAPGSPVISTDYSPLSPRAPPVSL